MRMAGKWGLGALVVIILVSIPVLWNVLGGSSESKRGVTGALVEEQVQGDQGLTPDLPLEDSKHEAKGSEERTKGHLGEPEAKVTVKSCSHYLSDACRWRMQKNRGFAIEIIKYQVENKPGAREVVNQIAMRMAPIDFFGQVVSEQGEPLAQVNVVYRIHYPFSLGPDRPVTVKTDQQGRFRIQGRAYALEIADLRKPGFEPGADFTQKRYFGGSRRDNYRPWEEASSSRPATFVLEPALP